VKLAQLGEFGFIERIRRSAPGREDVHVGIGDDCAAVALPPNELLLTTTDLLLEGTHFRREWTDMYRLGRKSVSVNVSDIAAMGGTPRQLFLGLAIPPDMPVEELDMFMEGFLEGAASYGAVLVGGDTCSSKGGFHISVTAQGSVQEDEMVCRGGARPGDAVYVSGTLGDSALALRILTEGGTPDPFLSGRHHDPEARTLLGRVLGKSRLPTSMIDISDGLLADLQHLLDLSALGAVVREDILPLSASFLDAMSGDPDLIELALTGGEDYELLFTIPPEAVSQLPAIEKETGVPLFRIGTIVSPEDGLVVKDRHGNRRTIVSKGYNHFSINAVSED